MRVRNSTFVGVLPVFRKKGFFFFLCSSGDTRQKKFLLADSKFNRQLSRPVIGTQFDCYFPYTS